MNFKMHKQTSEHGKINRAINYFIKQPKKKKIKSKAHVNKIYVVQYELKIVSNARGMRVKGEQ